MTRCTAHPITAKTTSPDGDASQHAIGVAYGLAAYVAWGLCPIYFKAIASVPPLEVLAHRVVWSVLLLVGILHFSGRLRNLLAPLRDGPTFRTLTASTVLIAINWYTFIWAIEHNLLVYAGLGYFINPLVNVALGFVFLRERLRRLQWLSVALAFAGVTYMTLNRQQLDTAGVFIAIVLAVSFALYALLRKTVRADAITGLTFETGLLLLPAIAYLVWLANRGESTFANVSPSMDALLIAAGAMTSIPLLWFANAARRLRLATIGFLQYISPSGQVLLAILVYNEPFTASHVVSFSFIWTALLIYSVDAAILQSKRRFPAPLTE